MTDREREIHEYIRDNLELKVHCWRGGSYSGELNVTIELLLRNQDSRHVSTDYDRVSYAEFTVHEP